MQAMRYKHPDGRNKRHARHFLREWRTNLEITQEQAMERLGWSQSKISRIENLQIPLTLDDLEEAAYFYGRSTWELMNVNPLVERDVVDMLPLLERANPRQRKEVADFAEFIRQRDAD
jgi:transcriptional regulator with XRE-family HTH domain